MNSIVIGDKEYVWLADAARQLRVKYDTLYKRVQRNPLIAREKRGRLTFVRLEDVLARRI